MAQMCPLYAALTQTQTHRLVDTDTHRDTGMYRDPDIDTQAHKRHRHTHSTWAHPTGV